MSSSWSWPGSAGGASTYATPSCTYTPTSDIASGACVFVTAANSGCPVGGANSIAYVNSRQRLKECGMTGWVAGNYTDSSAARTTGNNPGTSNNNADIKTGQGACATALITSSAAPAVSGWQVTYSCVPAE
jgi:hypothetical protein